MTLRHEAKVVFTTSLASELDMASKATMIRQALANMDDKVNFVVFDPDCEKKRVEDGGITVILPGSGLKELIFAQVDDYGGEDGKVLTIYKASER